MRWWLWFECLVGRHDYMDVWEYPVRWDPRERNAGQICTRCNHYRRVQK